MVQVLSRNGEAGSSTNIVGVTGRTVWRTCTHSLIVAFTITQVGLTVLMIERLDQQIRALDSLASGRHSQSLGLSPQSPVNINGANRTYGTISAIEAERPGSETLSALRTSHETRHSASADPEMAPSRRPIFRPPVIGSPVTLLDNFSAAMRRCWLPFKRHVPASLSNPSAKKQLENSR